ncbi:MAG: hypothetical protein NC191_01500 [Muribaculaceae bacterium]|nr:hypothetical protein [Muribaculaceae bacterium]
MDIAIQRGVTLDFSQRIRNISNLCKISNIEKMLSNCLESMPNKSPIDYVGELNKNDIMH